MSDHYFKNMMTGDITVSSGTPISSITISADSIRKETCLGSVLSECCYSVRTNCINCGAPLRGHYRCEYCGTVNQ